MEQSEDKKRMTRPLEANGSSRVTRRSVLKGAALLGGTALMADKIQRARAAVPGVSEGSIHPLARAENQIHSVCLQCHTACPIKVKILDGVAVKIDGSPYGTQTMLPHLPTATSLEKAASVDGKLCPKGQAGIQTLYDPHRLRKVLNRAGPRGANRWESIPFKQAVEEIVEGGRTFRKVPGERDRTAPGLRSLFVLRDAKLSKTMAADAKKVGNGKMTPEAFRAEYRDRMNVLIDPEHPDLGPKNNRFVGLFGRIEHGRKEWANRWLLNGFGSNNRFDHTSICEQSHHIAYKEMTRQFKKGKWTGGKTHMKPDSSNSEFIIFFGTGAFEANFGPTNMAEKVCEGLSTGRLKIAVVDPRLSKTAAKAWRWAPIRPGGDAALALGMIRVIIKEGRHDLKFLENANAAAAKADGETCWTGATHLVRLEPDGSPGAFLRAADLGLGPKDQLVVSRGGELLAVDPNGKMNPVEGDLDAAGEVNGIQFVSAFRILQERAEAKSLGRWARLAGLSRRTIVDFAREFTAHGKKAVAELYRGPVQHTHGYYTAQAIISLNLLVGNIDHRGGLIQGGGHWHELGDKPGRPFNVKKKLHPGKLTPFGVKLTREGSRYEKSTLFAGYPAKRPWFPFTSNVYQEILPSAEDGYPYPVQAVFLHMGTPVFATPAGHAIIDFLRDPKRLPLFVACDIVVAETSMYADYIIPDLSFLERWGTPHTTPDVLSKSSKVRQPTVAPITETVRVFGEEMPISMESFMLAVAERLNLPGYGKDGFGPGQDFVRPEDYYLRLAANLAAGDKPGEALPDADAREMRLFAVARRHLPRSVYDPKKWRKAAGPHWKRVVTLLNRGGRYEDFGKTYKNGRAAHAFQGMLNLYIERVAGAKDSMTGKRFSGAPAYRPVTEAGGKVVEDREFPLQLITYKEITGGHSRTAGNYWTQTAVLPENFILMNRRDVLRMGLRDGEPAALLCKTNIKGEWDLGNGDRVRMVGRVRAIEGMRPGVAAVSWHYGHWAYGARDIVVDGKTIKGDPRRATGLCPNAAMRIDEGLKNVCLSDVIGGSASFYDTRVKVVPA